MLLGKLILISGKLHLNNFWNYNYNSKTNGLEIIYCSDIREDGMYIKMCKSNNEMNLRTNYGLWIKNFQFNVPPGLSYSH